MRGSPRWAWVHLALVGFLLLLIFVLASSVIGLTRASVTAAAT
jgi:hypothetical protein